MKIKHPPTTLHIGCGIDKKKGALGVDFNPQSSADIIHDLNSFPYPFKKDQFEEVIAEHIIEHLDDVIKVMEELHRITKPGGIIYISSSHFSSVDSFNDITHKHFLTSRSFDYFIPGTDLYKYQYSPVQYRLKNVTLGPVKLVNPFLKLVLNLINKHRVFYESRFAFIFPIGVISYELETIK